MMAPPAPSEAITGSTWKSGSVQMPTPSAPHMAVPMALIRRA
jgi:hypothetical protein